MPKTAATLASRNAPSIAECVRLWRGASTSGLSASDVSASCGVCLWHVRRLGPPLTHPPLTHSTLARPPSMAPSSDASASSPSLAQPGASTWRNRLGISGWDACGACVRLHNMLGAQAARGCGAPKRSYPKSWRRQSAYSKGSLAEVGQSGSPMAGPRGHTIRTLTGASAPRTGLGRHEAFPARPQQVQMWPSCSWADPADLSWIGSGSVFV